MTAAATRMAPPVTCHLTAAIHLAPQTTVTLEAPLHPPRPPLLPPCLPTAQTRGAAVSQIADLQRKRRRNELVVIHLVCLHESCLQPMLLL